MSIIKKFKKLKTETVDDRDRETETGRVWPTITAADDETVAISGARELKGGDSSGGRSEWSSSTTASAANGVCGEAVPIERIEIKSSYKQLLQSLIMKKSDRIELIELNGNSKSLEFYKRVIIDGNLTEFVCCKNCQIVIQYLPKVGTSGLNRHSIKCNLKSAAAQPTSSAWQSLIPNYLSVINPSLEREVRSKKTVPVDVKSEVAEEMVKMVLDVRPFNFVDTLGFRNFCQKLIEIGSAYGNVDIDDVLPSNKSVKIQL